MTEKTLPPAPNVRVKPLEWEDCGEEMGWCADTVVGRYWVEDVHGKWQARFITMELETVHEEKIVSGKGFEVARGAAQADYARRILSALANATDLQTAADGRNQSPSQRAEGCGQ